MKVDAILARLQKVKGRNGSWTACCPAHKDKSPSLAIRETQDGRVLMHCFGGCSVEQVLDAIGMDMTDLFPDRPEYNPNTYATRAERPRFYASDLLRLIQFETTVVMVAAYDVATGKKLSEADMRRLESAHQRISAAMEAANVQS